MVNLQNYFVQVKVFRKSDHAFMCDCATYVYSLDAIDNMKKRIEDDLKKEN